MQTVSHRIPSGSGDRPLGLASAEAARRLVSIGPNALPERTPDPLWRRFLRPFASPLIYILLFALAFDIGLWLYEGTQAWPIETTAIGLILLFNAALGLYQEQRSEAALNRLKTLAGLRPGSTEMASASAPPRASWACAMRRSTAATLPGSARNIPAFRSGPSTAPGSSLASRCERTDGL